MTKVGYLGPEQVTFGYMAAEKFFGNDGVEYVPFPTHAEVAKATGRKVVDYGVMAIENIIDGVIAETARAMEEIDGKLGLKIHNEILLPIQLYYLRREIRTDSPKKILSHVSPIRQCSRFIGELQKNGIPVEVRESTGKAAEEASLNPEIAVIASSKAEQMYSLKRMVPDSIADAKKNFTRFWVVGKEHAQRDAEGEYKTCFLLNLTQSQAGCLCDSLNFFCAKGINLLLIYPNPIPGKSWEYTFVVEFSGHIEDNLMDEAWSELRNSGLSLNPPHFLGSYLAAKD